MVNPTRPPKHKPNEKHTLDEVLKSLNDLVRGEVLDKSAPAPAPAPKKQSDPAPIAGMNDIIKSLESLLDNDLGTKPVSAPTSSAPVSASPVVEQMTAPPQKTHLAKEESSGSDFLSEADIVKALEEISFDTETDTEATPVAPIETSTPEMDRLDVDAATLESVEVPFGFDLDTTVAEETVSPRDPEPEPEPPTPAPALELTLQEPTDHTPTGTQHELTFGAPLSLSKEPAPSNDADDIQAVEMIDAELAAPVEEAPQQEIVTEVIAETPADEITLESIGDEINAAPVPGEIESSPVAEEEILIATPLDDVGIDTVEAQPIESSLADDLATIDFSTDGLEFEPAPKPSADNFSVDFTPSKKAEPATETTETIEIAAPVTEEIEATTPEPEEAEEIEASLQVVEEEPVSAAEPEALQAAPEPQPEPQPQPPSEPDYSDIIERAEPPIAPVGGGKNLGSLGEFMELDMSASDSDGFTSASLSDLSEAPAIEAEPAIATTPAPATIEMTVAPTPASTPTVQEIPVLNNVAQVPPAEAFTLEPSPLPTPAPKVATSDLHQTAVRVIAKLNIELRKSGKTPLDAKAINRLQQLLKEALDKKNTK